MPVHLYLAPAGAGKTSFLVARARARAANAATVRVVVATRHQAQAWQRQLAEAGGALGVQVGTFDVLYRHVLRAAGEVYVRLSDPVQYRLLQTLIAGAPLSYYDPLRTKPGFVRVVLDLIRELKAGGVFPDKLLAAIEGMGNPARLRDLALLYETYQAHLQARGWADAAGIGWLAQEALQRQPGVAAGWPNVLVDGFDDLTSVQLAVLRELGGRVDELTIALTGEMGRVRRQAHQRFLRTRERIEVRLEVEAQPLPGAPFAARAPVLAHLEETLYARGEAQALEPGGADDHQVDVLDVDLALIAVTDREGEVRAALRWLKERLIADGVPLRGAALLARSMEAYRPYVEQVAAEYGLPVAFSAGTPLRGNPAVAALLDLSRLAAPGGEVFSWRQTVEAWRSPYTAWLVGNSGADAAALDRVARWGSVIGGLEQWREALDRLVESLSTTGEDTDREEEVARTARVLPDAEAAKALRARFERFVEQVTPPEGEQPCRVFVAWLESLIADEASGDEQPDGENAGQGVLQAALSGPQALADRDRAALIAFKDVLRGLVWAEEALGCQATGFVAFLDDLTGAVNTAVYRLPMPADREALLVADVTAARGVVFDAVAVLGLAEGEFPTALMEDPFLRDADRRRLNQEYGLEVDPSTASAEGAYFYEAITRPRKALLLTRPRIADNGAPWQASPFWEEVKGRVPVQEVELSSAHEAPPAQAASWPELLRAVSAQTARAHDDGAHAVHVWDWAARLDAERCAALASSARVLAHRVGGLPSSDGGRPPTPYDGGLAQWSVTFVDRFGPHHTWSASRLESYRACPFFFYVGSVLRLEPRAAPAEGLDARQLGNLYHRLMEGVYQHPSVQDPTDVDQLLDALPGVAAQILDDAPRREGFRATAWWAQTRREIVEDVRDSLLALDRLRGAYVPYAYEQSFGIPDRPQPALEIVDSETGDTLRVRGFIDRVDYAPDGRARIIDYKTGGPWGFTARAFEEGKKLQLALYARAAESLGLGEVADGYYWHVRHAAWHLENARKSAWVTLSKLGIADAIRVALEHSWATVRAVRAGEFAPHPPDDGCPDYCPAAAFCWHYAPREW